MTSWVGCHNAISSRLLISAANDYFCSKSRGRKHHQFCPSTPKDYSLITSGYQQLRIGILSPMKEFLTYGCNMPISAIDRGIFHSASYAQFSRRKKKESEATITYFHLTEPEVLFVNAIESQEESNYFDGFGLHPVVNSHQCVRRFGENHLEALFLCSRRICCSPLMACL
ncbi:hypothetical protein CEXT_191961 [Caerostris extrusa]|uniref:Uncharacterized protein n=1 Tax=Caerostris extrusa TaxID=172846 RepID=A0AAV4QI45_CAEEX|nr:hypothetical protein CEXT_191961 [Caerostris extrusa]